MTHFQYFQPPRNRICGLKQFKIKIMAQTFKIAKSHKLNEYFFLGDKSKVTEDLFWDNVKSKVKELTESEPDKYEEVFERAKDYLVNKKSSLTILGTWFEIKGRP
jgi:hypothetical protein